MVPMADINIIHEDQDYVNAHKQEIVDRYIDVFTNAQ